MRHLVVVAAAGFAMAMLLASLLPLSWNLAWRVMGGVADGRIASALMSLGAIVLVSMWMVLSAWWPMSVLSERMGHLKEGLSDRQVMLSVLPSVSVLLLALPVC